MAAEPFAHHWTRRRFLALSAAACFPVASFAAPQSDTPTDFFLWDVHLAVDKKALANRKRSADDLKRVGDILTRRIPILTLAKDAGKVLLNSENDIIVRVPADDIVAPQTAMLCRVGELEILHLDDLKTNFNPDGRYLIETLTIQGTETKTVTRFRDGKANQAVSPEKFLAQCPVIGTSADLEPDSAHRVGSGLQMAVRARFNDRVAKKLEHFADKPGRLLALTLDGQIISIHAMPTRVKQKGKKAPKDETEYGDVDILAGFGTEEEAQWLAVVLNSGPLPVPLTVTSSKIYVPDAAKTSNGT